MALTAGTRFGKYEILAPLGSGGMGEVYKARDPQLNRPVAIKILSEETARDATRLRRFQQEAQTVSQLSHPAIVTVYEMGTEPEPYIAMELVDGLSLRQMLRAGPTPIKRAIELASQIADGLATAHEAGIVHRDLKPENILVTPDARAKILDFGLAKLKPMGLGPNSQVATLQDEKTRPGAILGTVGYMSPEQARAEEADHKSDQFAFGTILYEMVTGARAFARQSTVEILTAIIREEPEPIDQLNPAIPPPLRWIIERCMEKPRGGRYSSTRDLARELSNLKEHYTEISAPSKSWAGVEPPRRPVRWRPAATGAALVAVGLVAGFLLKPAVKKPVEFRRLTFRRGQILTARFSPDGKSIAYAAAWEGEPARVFLALTTSVQSSRVLHPAPRIPMGFDGTGSQLLVIERGSASKMLAAGTLGWMPLLGGEVRPIVDDVLWADWASRGRFYAVVSERDGQQWIEIIDQDGTRRSIIDRTPGAFIDLRISPDESRIAYFHRPNRYDSAGTVRLARISGGEPEELTPIYPDCAGLAWNPERREIWFGAADRRYVHSVYAVRSAGGIRPLFSAPAWLRLLDVSRSGDSALLATAQQRSSIIVRTQGQSDRDLSWFDWSWISDLSKDGKAVLFFEAGTSTQGSSEIWMRRIDGSEALRLGDGEYGAFSPDGDWVAASTPPAAGPAQIVLLPTGPGQVKQVTSGPGTYGYPRFLADGRSLLVSFSDGSRPSAIRRLSLDGKVTDDLTPSGCSRPVPDSVGAHFACVCDKGRSLEVFSVEGDRRKQLWTAPENDRATPLRWNSKGNMVIVLLQSAAKILAIPVEGGPSKEIATLAPADRTGFLGVFSAAVTSDGDTIAWTVGTAHSDMYLANHLP